MIRHMSFSIFGAYLCLLLLGCATPALVSPHQLALPSQAFQTQGAVVHYDNPASLQIMDRKLRFTPVANYQQVYSSGPADPAQAAIPPGLAAKIDGLLAKVCQVLNRRPKQAAGLHIFLLRNGKQVGQQYQACQPAHQASPIFGYGALEGFYDGLTHSIFLSLEDLHEGILAHEMTHFILCVSSAAPPPAGLQENWARYVETKVH